MRQLALTAHAAVQEWRFGGMCEGTQHALHGTAPGPSPPRPLRTHADSEGLVRTPEESGVPHTDL